MTIVNLWFGMGKAESVVVKDRLNHDEERDGEYTGPITDREYRLFNYMRNAGRIQRLFKEATVGGDPWLLWNLTFNEKGSVLQKIKTELDALLVKYPGKVAVAGAWLISFNAPFSRQVGTQYKIESVEQFGNDPQFDQPDVTNPDFQPDDELPDYDPRETIPDPNWTAPDPWPQLSGGFADEITGTTGTPAYPIPVNALKKFMPDVWNGDDPPTYSPATELSDVLIGQGWAPRRFT